MYKEKKTYNQILAENLKLHMRAKGYSTHQLGRKIGVSGMTISNWLNMKSEISNENVDKLIKELNISRSEFITDPEEIPNLSVPAAHTCLYSEPFVQETELCQKNHTKAFSLLITPFELITA